MSLSLQCRKIVGWVIRTFELTAGGDTYYMESRQSGSRHSRGNLNTPIRSTWMENKTTMSTGTENLFIVTTEYNIWCQSLWLHPQDTRMESVHVESLIVLITQNWVNESSHSYIWWYRAASCTDGEHVGCLSCPHVNICCLFRAAEPFMMFIGTQLHSWQRVYVLLISVWCTACRCFTG